MGDLVGQPPVQRGRLAFQAAGDLAGDPALPGQQPVGQRHHEEGEKGGRQDARQHHRADHHLGFGPGAGGQDQGHGAGGLTYFFIPTDLVPDFIPLLGFVDDLAVLTTIVNALQGELADYRGWRKWHPRA